MLTNSLNKTIAQGNGATTVFNYNFYLPSALNLEVTYTNPLTDAVDPTGKGAVLAAGLYVVTGVGNALGGTVTYNPGAPIVLGTTLTMRRVIAYTQPNTLNNQGGMFPAVAEASDDNLEMQIQQLVDILGRQLTLPVAADPVVISTILPMPVAGATFTWDATGKSIVNVTLGALGAIGLPVGAGIATYLGANVFASRTLTAADGTIVITNGNGVAGNPTIGVPALGIGTAQLANNAVTGAKIDASLGLPPVRQTALTGNLDANGFANFITTGAGLRPGLLATAKPLVLTYAAGWDASGMALDPRDEIVADVADILGADLPLNNTSFIRKDQGGAWGFSLVPPQYGYAFDRTRYSLLNMEGANGGIVFLDDYGNTWARNGANVVTDTAQKQFGASSAKFTGAAGDYINSANFTSLGAGSWELSCWFRFAAVPGVGTNAFIIGFTSAGGFGAVLFANNTAGVTKLFVNLSSNNASQDIANGTPGTNALVINTWYRARLVFDALAGTYRVYLSAGGAAETQELNIASGSKICQITQGRLGADSAGNQNLNGWVDAFRLLPCATNTTTEVPAAVAPVINEAGKLVNFFSIPDMKMYEASAASGAAGTNPTLTGRSRVFVADCDTSGAAVTAARTYALRGQYQSVDTAIPGLAVRTAFSCNMGCDLMTTEIWVRCFQSNNGFSAGQLARPNVGHAAFSDSAVVVIEDRNNLSVVTGDTTNMSLVNRTSGLEQGIGGTFKMFVTARRTF